MLSGGERALAVALLLAMLEVRPVPFCVLDEVDAALDEANVGRFSTALRSLAEEIQFVVITHNRGTIEAADALYGVTVGDDAVSRASSRCGWRTCPSPRRSAPGRACEPMSRASPFPRASCSRTLFGHRAWASPSASGGFGAGSPDVETWEEVEEALISADLGAAPWPSRSATGHARAVT